MIQRLDMPDLLVLIPGIMGSVLVKDGRELWGLSLGSVIENLLTFGSAFRELQLPAGIGHEDPKDGVHASRPLPGLGIIPRFWKVDGYGRLADHLRRRFTLTKSTADSPGNFLEFPYDWRLSNQLNGQRLSDAVMPALEGWQAQTENRDAKLIFVCHSMGGLVARWFLEVLGGRDLTKALVTIGTPYRGSINALTTLGNGLFLGIRPIGLSLDAIVRSFPSIHQLLPTFDCIDCGDGKLLGIGSVDVPNVGRPNILAALEFHRRIAAQIEKNPTYRTFAIKGIDQPTGQSATLRGSTVEAVRSRMGVDLGGDGTVPRLSSHPPEWPDGANSGFFAQSHAMLQSTDTILTQVAGILIDLNQRGYQGGSRIALDVPDVASAGETVQVNSASPHGVPDLALQIVCQREDGIVVGHPTKMTPTGDGHYRAKIGPLAEGAWRITVQAPPRSRLVDPVSDWMLVLGGAALDSQGSSTENQLS